MAIWHAYLEEYGKLIIAVDSMLIIKPMATANIPKPSGKLSQ